MKTPRFAAAMLVVMLVVPSAAVAVGTPAERAACKSDALRLCSAVALARALFGDNQGVFDCFQINRRNLGRACSAVLKKHGY